MSEIKTDCFAYRLPSSHIAKEHCEALTELFCKKETCRFYKPKEDLNHIEKKG